MNRSITEKREILAARIFHVATSMRGPTTCAIYFNRHNCHQIWPKRLDRLDMQPATRCLNCSPCRRWTFAVKQSWSARSNHIHHSITLHWSASHAVMIYQKLHIHHVRSMNFRSILLVPPLCCQKARTYSQGTRQSQWKPRVTKTLPWRELSHSKHRFNRT